MLQGQCTRWRRLSLFLLLLFVAPQPPHAVQAKTAAKHKKTSASAPVKKERATNLFNHASQVKDWNILVYFAAQNNLYRFVDLNLSQMEQIGSNENINIIGHVDQFRGEEVHRCIVHKGHIEKVWTVNNISEQERLKNKRKYTSGTRESLEDFLEWAIKTYPARKQCVVFWNHGSGIIDPPNWGRLITELHQNFFTFNAKTGKLELDRDDLLKQLKNEQKKGVAFNDITGQYLTNQDLSEALENVSKKMLGDKRFDIVGMDACCMAEIELAAQVERCADYFIASQEVELGAGWNYVRALHKVSRQKLSPLELAKEITFAYAREYKPITDDYTLSVTDLHWINNESRPAKNGPKRTQFSKLQRDVTRLSNCLIDLLNNKNVSKKMRNAIRQARKKATDFFDDNYIDYYHFVFELQEKGRQVLKGDNMQQARQEFMRFTRKCLKYIERSVALFVAGDAYKGTPLPGRSRGLSIYFPAHVINSSYYKTTFARNSKWLEFLELYHSK